MPSHHHVFWAVFCSQRPLCNPHLIRADFHTFSMRLQKAFLLSIVPQLSGPLCFLVPLHIEPSLNQFSFSLPLCFSVRESLAQICTDVPSFRIVIKRLISLAVTATSICFTSGNIYNPREYWPHTALSSWKFRFYCFGFPTSVFHWPFSSTVVEILLDKFLLWGFGFGSNLIIWYKNRFYSTQSW